MRSLKREAILREVESKAHPLASLPSYPNFEKEVAIRVGNVIGRWETQKKKDENYVGPE